jgi:hypothetical protein
MFCHFPAGLVLALVEAHQSWITDLLLRPTQIFLFNLQSLNAQ